MQRGAARAAPAPQTHSSPIAVEPRRRASVRRPPGRRQREHPGRRDALHRARDPARRGAAPAVDPTTSRFDPAVEPRALALDSTGATLYVTGERSGRLYAIDTAKVRVKGSCRRVLRAGRAARRRRRRRRLRRVLAGRRGRAGGRRVAAGHRDGGHAAQAVGARVGARRAHALRHPSARTGRERAPTSPLALQSTWTVPDKGPESDPTEPHGQVRGIYDVVARPGANELWVAHLMLGTDTSQPTLAFNSTVFPALSILDPASGNQLARLSVQATTSDPGDNGAFGDVVSGPRSMAFSGDGKYAFVVDTDSEDLLVVDATQRVEVALVRPLPGHMPEGVVWVDNEVYVQERNTEDIVAFKVQEGGDAGVTVTQDGCAVQEPVERSDAREPALGAAAVLLGQQRRLSAHPESLGRVRELPRRGAQRRGDVALCAGPARHAVERGRDDRHGLSLPHGRPFAGAGLLEDDRQRAGRRFSSRRRPAAAPRCDRELRQLRDPGSRAAVDRRDAHDHGRRARDAPDPGRDGLHANRLRESATTGPGRPTPAAATPC